ncbi:MAG TPA: hypothetical protein VE757_09925, partial [Gaiellaceae bacterium]|nr:hypothetical protein [Gaiellaceae bacterium]
MLLPELAAELRNARPVASTELRERVSEIAARERPAPRPRFSLPPFRRLALVAVPAALAVAVGAALVHGLASSGQNGQKAAPGPVSSGSTGSGGSALTHPRALQLEKTPGQPYSAVAPSSARLQQYGAFLRLQVRDLGALSDTTKRAMRFARLVGGYVAYVRYSSPKQGQGSAAHSSTGWPPPDRARAT